MRSLAAGSVLTTIGCVGFYAYLLTHMLFLKTTSGHTSLLLPGLPWPSPYSHYRGCAAY